MVLEKLIRLFKSTTGPSFAQAPTTPLVNGVINRPGTTVHRSLGARLSDTFNVRDFGAIGDNSTDNQAFIQNAINAAQTNNGGTIVFPPGNYKINGRLAVDGTKSYRLTFIGTGADANSGGTMISGNFADYLLYIGHSSTNNPKLPVGLIQGIQFSQGHTGICTSTEPPPDGNGFGCLYIGSAGSGMILSSCYFIGEGVAIFSACGSVLGGGNASAGLLLVGTGANADYVDSSGSNTSFGLVARSAKVLACKFFRFGTALEFFRGISVIDNMDLEVSGYGVNIGENQLSYWEPDNNSGNGGIQAPGINPVTGGSISQFTGESNTLVAIRVKAASNFSISAACANFHAAAPYGFYSESMRNCAISVNMSGAYITAALALGQAGHGGNCLIEGSVATQSGGAGTTWMLPAGSYYDVGDDPFAFRNCVGQDGGVTFTNLPSSPSANNTVYVVCTDSTVPAWSGTVSNIGKPITGGGTNRVMARYSRSNPLAANGTWTTGTTITMAAANPGGIVPGMSVFDVTNGFAIGTVSTWPTGGSTTLTLTAGALHASLGAADNLTFSAWTVAG